MQPIIINFPSVGPQLIDSLWIDNNRLISSMFVDYTSVGNRKLWASDAANADDGVKNLCKSVNSEYHHEEKFNSQKYYVAGFEEVIDIATGLVVTKTDEYIDIVTDVKCLKTISTTSY